MTSSLCTVSVMESHSIFEYEEKGLSGRTEHWRTRIFELQKLSCWEVLRNGKWGLGITREVSLFLCYPWDMLAHPVLYTPKGGSAALSSGDSFHHCFTVLTAQVLSWAPAWALCCSFHLSQMHSPAPLCSFPTAAPTWEGWHPVLPHPSGLQSPSSSHFPGKSGPVCWIQAPIMGWGDPGVFHELFISLPVSVKTET